MNRRKFLRNSSLLGLGAGLLPNTDASANEGAGKAAFRAVFLSDVHVKPTEIAENGMRQAFRKANALKPDFIINGGDAIMDAMKADKAKVQAQWDVWNRVIGQENRLPVYHAIGNHDAWGWQMEDAAIKSDPLYDKGWVIKEHKMPGRYYAFTKQNWKFIVLDSAHENNGGYIAKIDDPQYEWLKTELSQTPAGQHIAIVSHIPVVSFCSAMFTDENQPNGDWRISRALLHTDARKLVNLFAGYKNIRGCLSGHIHLQDAVEYKGIHYYCNGAVSGNWWGGAFKGFDPAFALFSFGKDGSISREIINY
jgi:3',5'-cyclic-AMP phosphodiesterase